MATERTEQVVTYVTPEVKEQIKREAKREDIPMSKHVRGLLDQARLEDTAEQHARDLNAEERLLEIVAEGKDEMETIAERISKQNHAIAGLMTYPVVNFQLLKAAHSPPEPTINDWFDEARNRLRVSGGTSNTDDFDIIIPRKSETDEDADGGEDETAEEADAEKSERERRANQIQ